MKTEEIASHQFVLTPGRYVGAEDAEENGFARPDTSIMRAWSAMADPLFARAFSNDCETSHLSGVRDTLLPRLLSGDIRVHQPQRFIGAST